jgi:hypothetical protein
MTLDNLSMNLDLRVTEFAELCQVVVRKRGVPRGAAFPA